MSIKKLQPGLRQCAAARSAIVFVPYLLMLSGLLLGPAAAAISDSSRNHDFDFEFGAWNVHLLRLVDPLDQGNEWVEHTGTSVVTPVWNGQANLGELHVEGASGAITGLSLRLFDPSTQLWRIHWANARSGLLGDAMVGGFQEGVGEFHNREIISGRAVDVRFVFDEITPTTFRFEQAFSFDDGATWHVNWIARFERIADHSADAGVRDVWRSLDESWNSRDAATFARLFSEQTSFRFVDRDHSMAGRAEVHAHFTEHFGTLSPAIRHRTTINRVRALSPDLQTLDGRVDILRPTSGPDEEPEVFRSFELFSVMVRHDDQWLIDVLRVYQLP